jgi:beta-lactamase regulating signal transducer with metallopeptidase domain
MSFSFLWEMSWKSALIVALALSLATLLRSRSPADRAAVLRLGVSLLLMLPLIALFLPALQIETPAETLVDAGTPLAFEPVTGAEAAPLEIAALQPVPTTIWDDPSSLILILYIGGLLMVGARIAAGLATLRRWTRTASPMTDPDWLRAMSRVRPQGRAGERIRLLVCDETPAPLSWGWLKPAILIDRDTLERVEDADAILAHEVAHVVRGDWPALMMARLSVAIFWFNPLAWLLERELVQQAEEAADCSALGQIEPTQYAQTLVSCAQTAAAAAAAGQQHGAAGERAQAAGPGDPVRAGNDALRLVLDDGGDAGLRRCGRAAGRGGAGAGHGRICRRAGSARSAARAGCAPGGGCSGCSGRSGSGARCPGAGCSGKPCRTADPCPARCA